MFIAKQLRRRMERSLVGHVGRNNAGRRKRKEKLSNSLDFVLSAEETGYSDQRAFAQSVLQRSMRTTENIGKIVRIANISEKGENG